MLVGIEKSILIKTKFDWSYSWNRKSQLLLHNYYILSIWKWNTLPINVLHKHTHFNRHLGLAYFYLENSRNKWKISFAANSRVNRRETQKHLVRITIHQSSLLFTFFEFVCRHRLSNCLRKNMWFELLPTIWL